MAPVLAAISAGLLAAGFLGFVVGVQARSGPTDTTSHQRQFQRNETDTCRAAERRRPTDGIPASIPYHVGRYAGATLEYGPHYSFYPDIDKIMKEHVNLFKAWHPGGTLLDIGGRNGELHSLARNYGYAILERDMPNAWAQRRFKYYACDLYDCRAKLVPCLVEIIYCNNVLEHLLMPHRAMVSVAELLKPGGLLMLKTQWLWRYHATKTCK